MICLSIKLENPQAKELSLRLTNVNIAHGTGFTAVMAIRLTKEYGINQTSPYAPQLLTVNAPAEHILQVASIWIQACNTHASPELVGHLR